MIEASNVSKVIILHRHGARGPAGGEMSAFSVGSPVHAQWHESEVDNITPVGHEQMRSLGKWISDKYMSSTTEGRWLASSFSDRAVESGSDLTQEINRLNNFSIFPTHPDGIDKTLSADDVFRAWRVDEVYMTMQSQIQDNDEWRQKSMELHDFMECLYSKLSSPFSQSPDETRLFYLTQIFGMSECEANSDSNNRKGELSSRLSKDDLIMLDSAARWVWSRRFTKSSCGDLLGGNLANIVIQDLSGQHNLCIYSAHDYTILSLLTAIGIWLNAEYPAPILGFGSYLLFEVHNDGRLALKLNPRPFLVDDLVVHEDEVVCLFEWSSISEFTNMVQTSLESQHQSRRDH